MVISEIKEKEIWENFLLGCKEKTFLQAFHWGEFQKMMGNKIWRFGIYENNSLISVALIIKVEAKRGDFLFCPHGPIAKPEVGSGKYEVLKLLLEELKKIAKKEKASFIRISPIWIRNDENIKIFKELGFREAPIHMHPELTWELDITPSEDELLMQMRKTTRYLIKQAHKSSDVRIDRSQRIEDIEEFDKLYQATVDRHHFIPFSLDYFKNEISAFLPDNQSVRQAQGCPEYAEGQVMIFLGKYKEELIASAIIIFWQNIAFYHHGASSQKYPKIPVSYLLLWETIREAKRRGCQKFNFWGITEKNWKLEIGNWKFGRHPWVGLTLFKKGFGGYKKEYVKTQDFVISQKYWLNYLVERIRKSKRGF